MDKCSPNTDLVENMANNKTKNLILPTAFLLTLHTLPGIWRQSLRSIVYAAIYMPKEMSLTKQVDPPSLAGFLLHMSERPSCFHFINTHCPIKYGVLLHNVSITIHQSHMNSHSHAASINGCELHAAWCHTSQICVFPRGRSHIFAEHTGRLKVYTFPNAHHSQFPQGAVNDDVRVDQ